MTRVRKFSSAVLATAGIGFLPAVSTAQQQPASPAACYVPGSGTVYLIKKSGTPATCRTGHMEFSMASLGSGGPQLAGGKGGGSGLPTNDAGAFDFSNGNGLLSVGTFGTGNLPAAGAGTRLMWYPGKAALRAGSVTQAQWDDSNIGNRSVAFGENTIASGSHSLAMGHYSVATGFSSTALGVLATASGQAATALGELTTASGKAAIAVGVGSTASGYSSVAIGDQTIASGNHSVALGESTKATGNRATALGYFSTASGLSASAFGHQTVASGIGSTAIGNFASTNAKTGAFVYGDASSTTNITAVANNQFVVRAQRVWLGTNNAVTATANRFLETSTGAYLSTGGVWISSSDSARKHNWQDVDGETVLEKLAAVPVLTWSYRDEDSTVRHMGPTAQEFHAAFGLGDTDKGIGTVDADGVALAGIKALSKRTADLHRENQELKITLAEMSRRLAELEAVRQ